MFEHNQDMAMDEENADFTTVGGFHVYQRVWTPHLGHADAAKGSTATQSTSSLLLSFNTDLEVMILMPELQSYAPSLSHTSDGKPL